MPEYRLAVDPETASALQTETDLLGFGDVDDYLAWIVDNRAAIEQGTESAELLDSYQERLIALEERLTTEGVDPATVDTDAEPLSNATPVGDPVSSGDPASTGDRPTGWTVERPADRSREESPRGSREEATGRSREESTGRDGIDTIETSTDRSPSVDTRPSEDPPRTGHTATGERGADVDGDARRAASDGGVSTQSEITSMHLQPESVQRVREDPVTEDADSLKDVETNRLDELSRRAVAETREQLDRAVETGLDYSSATALDESSVRPGEDLADLDALDVPGRTQGLVEARRVVVGRALAYLRDVGRARRSDFVTELYEDWPAGYETPAGWWRCVRESLRQVDAVEGGQVWRYEK